MEIKKEEMKMEKTYIKNPAKNELFLLKQDIRIDDLAEKTLGHLNVRNATKLSYKHVDRHVKRIFGSYEVKNLTKEDIINEYKKNFSQTKQKMMRISIVDLL